MNALDTVIERVYFYINNLTLSGKVKLLGTFTRLSVTEKDNQFVVDGIVRDVEFTEDYVKQHLRWLRMSEIDNIYNYITSNK